MLLRLLLPLFLILSVAQTKEQQTLHMGYYLPSFNNVSKKDVKISLNFWAKEIGTKTGLRLTNHFYKNIHQLKKDFDAGKIDSINASLPLIASLFDINTLKNGFRPVINGQENGTEMLILVQKKSRFKSLKDLQHKRLLRLPNNDLEKLYLDTLLLKKFHKDTKRFFGKTGYVKQYNKAIMKLFFKKSDAALVTRQSFELAAELNPQIARKLKPVYTFSIPVNNGSFFRRDYSKKNIINYRKIAFNLNKTPRGKQILQVFKCDKIVENSLDDIRIVQQIQREYRRLKQKEH